jgi:hypothetical protein
MVSLVNRFLPFTAFRFPLCSLTNSSFRYKNVMKHVTGARYPMPDQVGIWQHNTTYRDIEF